MSVGLLLLLLMLSISTMFPQLRRWGEHSGLLLRRYPATYLHGAALSSGWAVANCVSSYGGEPVTVPSLQPAQLGRLCSQETLHSCADIN